MKAREPKYKAHRGKRGKAKPRKYDSARNRNLRMRDHALNKPDAQILAEAWEEAIAWRRRLRRGEIC
jgi:hypothetical protein